MKKIIIANLLSLFFLTSIALAGEVREIELTDGSVLTGEVLSLSGGIYTVKTDSLGTIKLEEKKIRAIRVKSPSGGTASATTGSGADVRALQEKMMSDKDVVTMIQSLQNDPDFKKLLEDPEVMKAVQSGDIATLMANPQFMKLLNNPTVRDIEKKVQ